MPGKGYIISSKKEGCKGNYAVVSRDSGRILGCHDTHDKAVKQLSAIYASENKKNK